MLYLINFPFNKEERTYVNLVVTNIRSHRFFFTYFFFLESSCKFNDLDHQEEPEDRFHNNVHSLGEVWVKIQDWVGVDRGPFDMVGYRPNSKYMGLLC